MKVRLIYFCYFLYSLYPIYILINFFRYFGKSISPQSHVFSKKISRGVRIMPNVFIDQNCSIDEGTYIAGSNLGNITKIINTSIGKYSSIGPNFQTAPYGHNYKNVSSFPFSSSSEKEKVISKKITINNDVWVGTNVIVLGGVTLGDGVVIGAGSVVTKSIPPYAIAAGNPAKVIKFRFSPAMIKKLQKIQWWNSKKAQKLILKYNSDIHKFVNLLK